MLTKSVRRILSGLLVLSMLFSACMVTGSEAKAEDLSEEIVEGETGISETENSKTEEPDISETDPANVEDADKDSFQDVVEESESDEDTETFAEEDIDVDPGEGRLAGNISEDFYGINSFAINTNVVTHASKFQSGYTIEQGIDVSKYDGDLDWSKIKSAGVDFAIIRVGYRSTGSSGSLNTDPYAKANLKGAYNAGVPFGIYIFSQATTTSEAKAEADYAIQILENAGYGSKISLPVVMDFEYYSDGGNGDQGRLYNAKLSKSAATEVCNAFCSEVRAKGYDPMVYANRSMLNSKMNASSINGEIWVAEYANSCAFTGDYSYWQYTSSGTISGFGSHKFDMDFHYVPGIATPTLKSASASTDGIKITWGSVSDVSGYRVYRKTSGGSWAAIGTTTSTSYTDSSALDAGTTYYYTVRAYSGDLSTALANTYDTEYWSGFDSAGVSAKAVGIVSAPSLSKATASSGSITVTWNSVSNASGYRVYRKPSGGSWAAIGTTISTSYTDSSKLEIGTTYYYTVRAYKGEQSTALANAHDFHYWSDFNSTGVSAKAVGALSTPSLKSATSSAGAITVNWSSVSGAGGYRVYRKPSGGSWAAIGYTTGTNYTDDSILTVGNTYYYTVRAYKGDYSTAVANAHYSNYWSDFDSKGVSAVAKVNIETPALSNASASSGSITISWKSVSNADGYRVYRKVKGGSWAAIGNTTSLSYKDSSKLDIGTTYYYTVRAYKGDYSTALANTYSSKYWSDFVSAGVSAKATGVVSTPSLKSATASAGSIQVSWGSVSNASGYRVYRKPSGGSWAAIGYTTGTSYTDSSKLEIGTTYYYTVRAYKGDYSTALSNAHYSNYWSDFDSKGVSAKATGVVSTPSLKSATASAESIQVSWGSVSNASGYRVYRKPLGGSWAAIGYTTGTSYTDSSKLEIGTTYYYTVRAYKGDYSTALSNAHYSNYWSDFDSKGVSAKATGVVSTPPLKSATATDEGITITWGSVNGADGYRVYRKTSGGSWAAIGATEDTSYIDSSNMKSGTTYYYTVRAYKGDYTTALSNAHYSNYWSDFDSKGVSATASASF